MLSTGRLARQQRAPGGPQVVVASAPMMYTFRVELTSSSEGEFLEEEVLPC